MLTLIRLLFAIALAAALLAITVFSPLSTGVLLGGAVAGWGIRAALPKLLSLSRQDAVASGREAAALLRTAFTVFLFAVAVLGVFVSVLLIVLPQVRSQARGTRVHLLGTYKGDLEFQENAWSIKEELRVAEPEAVALRSSASGRPMTPERAMAVASMLLSQNEWQHSHVEGREHLYYRDRNVPASAPHFLWGSVDEIDLPLIAGSSDKLVVRLTQFTEIKITAPRYLIDRTEPPWTQRDDGVDGETERILLEKPSFPIGRDPVIRMAKAHPVWWTPPLRWVRDLHAVPGILWILGLLGLIFNKQVEEVTEPLRRRINAWLGVRKPQGDCDRKRDVPSQQAADGSTSAAAGESGSSGDTRKGPPAETDRTDQDGQSEEQPVTSTVPPPQVESDADSRV